MTLDPQNILAAHRKRFHDDGLAVSAPGRVNLIGEHTDYSDGFVMPAAIDFETIAAVSPRKDGHFVVYSANFDEEAHFTEADLPHAARHHWTDYSLGVLWALRKHGIQVPGFSLTLSGNVPLGSGLSSSASVEVATALALLQASASSLPPKQVALLCQLAENGFVGAQSGIMDQFIACCGQKDHALLLDCRSLEYRLVPIPDHLRIIICNSMIRHSHSGGQYNTRRAEVEAGVAVLQRHRPEIAKLRDATLDDLARWGSEMTPESLARCRHIVMEDIRTLAAAAALDNGELETVGTLMAEAHRSIRDDFAASCAELDLLVELASRQPGCIGARMTGGGFGGCTVNLVNDTDADQFIEDMRTRYLAATGIMTEIYLCRASDGARSR